MELNREPHSRSERLLDTNMQLVRRSRVNDFVTESKSFMIDNIPKAIITAFTLSSFVIVSGSTNTYFGNNEEEKLASVMGCCIIIASIKVLLAVSRSRSKYQAKIFDGLFSLILTYAIIIVPLVFLLPSILGNFENNNEFMKSLVSFMKCSILAVLFMSITLKVISNVIDSLKSYTPLFASIALSILINLASKDYVTSIISNPILSNALLITSLSFVKMVTVVCYCIFSDKIEGAQHKEEEISNYSHILQSFYQVLNESFDWVSYTCIVLIVLYNSISVENLVPIRNNAAHLFLGALMINLICNLLIRIKRRESLSILAAALSLFLMNVITLTVYAKLTMDYEITQALIIFGFLFVCQLKTIIHESLYPYDLSKTIAVSSLITYPVLGIQIGFSYCVTLGYGIYGLYHTLVIISLLGFLFEYIVYTSITSGIRKGSKN